MIYTDLTKTALALSFELHKDQFDKSGLPYIFHPFHLAEQMSDEYSVCVALLHDVIEDTDTTIMDLRTYGFPDQVLDAIVVLTRSCDTDYFDYITKVKKNPLARAVKLEDLKHNMDMTRLKYPTQKDFRRLEKYKKAYAVLLEK